MIEIHTVAQDYSSDFAISQSDNDAENISSKSMPDVPQKTISSVYRERLSVLTMLKQLVHLCRDIQKHRGLGIGLLAGTQVFLDDFNVLQQQVNRRIQLLHQFVVEGSPLRLQDMVRVQESWVTIREGWHDDSVLENFQFHCHFIEQILQIVSELSQCLHYPLLENNSQTDNSDPVATQIDVLGSQNHSTLLNFITMQLPKTIEYLGMVRALSTHAATIGYSIKDHDQKLKFLCQCVNTEKRTMIQQVDELLGDWGNSIPSLLSLKTYEYKIDAFIDKVLREVVSQSEITVTSVDLFATATNIMDVYWRVVDDGFNSIQHLQDQGLERWCIYGA